MAIREAEPDPATMSREQFLAYLRSHHTVSLWPFTGRALRLSRSATYKCPDIKVLRLGHLSRVSSSWLEHLLFDGD